MINIIIYAIYVPKILLKFEIKFLIVILKLPINCILKFKNL